MSLSNTYVAKIQDVYTKVGKRAEKVMEAEGAEFVVGSGAQIEWVKDVCGTDQVCDVATAVSEDEM